MELVKGVYLYTPPAEPRAPVVFEVPRSGREYPPGFHSSAPFAAVHALTSMYVEEMWGLAPNAGCGLLFATFSNNWIDANRALDDIDPALVDGWPEPVAPSAKSGRGMGLFHATVKGGFRLHDRKLTVAEARDRIDNYWRPYHDRLAALIFAERRRAGVAFHLSCHSMTTIGPADFHDHGRRRKEFCLSDLDGATTDPDFMQAIADEIRRLGYGVTFNDPFKGNESIRRHANPRGGVHSVQIEMIRGMYYDEETFEKRPDFDRIRGDLGRIAGRIADYARSRAR